MTTDDLGPGGPGARDQGTGMLGPTAAPPDGGPRAPEGTAAQPPANTAAAQPRANTAAAQPAGSPTGTDWDVERLRRDAAAWDDFVASLPMAPYVQASPWARVKAANGWRAERVVVEGAHGPVGAQVLLRNLGPSPWSVGYAPRGPVGVSMTEDDLRRFTDALRRAARGWRVSHVVIDPEIDADSASGAWLAAAGWRPAPSPQPERSRWVDLRRPEEVLWSELRPKWRQYVQKARRLGVSIVESDAGGLDRFYEIYVETARRAGFVHRAASAYREVYLSYAARGQARLLFARDTRGETTAVLMLIGWGRRIVEPYGGMTDAGAEQRANYLLKWEAIASSRARGYEVYDMWGLSHEGIAHFKAGFGGREVRFVGGWDLVTAPAVHAAFVLARRAYVAASNWSVRRARRPGTRQAAGGTDADA